MPRLEYIRNCLEGAVPSCIATSDFDGLPNVSYVSQVHYIDSHHVGLTFQFFNKTHSNINCNPQATVIVTDPDTAAQYRLALLFQHSVTHGALFESAKAKLAGIASHTGMISVFHLRGVDVYRVLDIQQIQTGNTALASPVTLLLPKLKVLGSEMKACLDLKSLFETTVRLVSEYFDSAQVSLLMADEYGKSLYTVAVAGTTETGVGSEVPFGFGIIGVCAQERVPIRIAFGSSEYSYRNAIAHYSQLQGAIAGLETSISFHELAEPTSQLAIPLLTSSRIIGVLYLESDTKRRFKYEDEDALTVLAELLVAHYQLISTQTGTEPMPVADPATNVAPAGTPLPVRYYSANHSIFIDNNYLIKGVAGAILWRILQQHQQHGRCEFTNRELRLDPSLGLPELSENLESRLVLLQKRLDERCVDIVLQKAGRGRFRLVLKRPVQCVVET